jgi:hypothetical protein
LRQRSRFVKDVFGIKIVVADEENAYGLLDSLRALEWSADVLAQFGIPSDPSTRQLLILEVKDYLATSSKASGWQAIKAVVRWCGTTVEIQVQPLRNYQRERERLTRESHAEFKARRDELRNRVASDVPLFGYYRDLLRWLFLSPDEPAPAFGSVHVLIED